MSRTLAVRKLVNSLDRPAALIARDHTVLFSNRRFRRMLGKSNHDVVGLKLGSVLECKYSALDRCRETVVCPYCKLRRLIELTRSTDEKLSEIAISFAHKSGAIKRLEITTEKAGQAVLLILTSLPADV